MGGKRLFEKLKFRKKSDNMTDNDLKKAAKACIDIEKMSKVLGKLARELKGSIKDNENDLSIILINKDDLKPTSQTNAAKNATRECYKEFNDKLQKINDETATIQNSLGKILL